MAKYLIQSESLTAIADEIRVLSDTEDAMSLSAMESHISEANIDITTQADLITQIASALENKATPGQATPVISVNNSNGLITATAGTKSSTYQLAFQPAKTITPSSANQIAVSSGYYTGGNVTINGDSNLIAENIKSGISIFGVSGNYEGNGGGDIDDSFITRTISSCINNRVTTIGSYAFYWCSSLTSVSFPAATSIGSYAFYYCSNLTTANIPAAKTIGAGAFHNCEELTEANFPVATKIEYNAFNYCFRLTTANIPAATHIGNSAFQECKSLTTVNFPVASSINDYAFARCIKLATVSFPVATFIGANAFQYCDLIEANFPAVTTIGSRAFSDCESLTTANFPAATKISSAAFTSCYSLTTASFPAMATIGSSAFKTCYNLKSLYLTGSSLCFLSNSNAFYSTPIGGYSASAGTYGSIYVPASLLTSYQTATNWTYFSSRFVGI